MGTNPFSCYAKVISVYAAKGRRPQIIAYLEVDGGRPPDRPVALDPSDKGVEALKHCAETKSKAFLFFSPGEHEHVVSAVFPDPQGQLREIVKDNKPVLEKLKGLSFQPSYILQLQ